MSKLCVRAFSVSLDGYGAGPDQSLENPLGVDGMKLHRWAFTTRTFRKMFGQDGGETDVDDEFAARGFANLGAWIMGRNMFGPIRGKWPDESWKGWWGDKPPYHVPVFVLTHHARAPLVMEGGTTFHFVTDGIQSALAQARDAAGDKDVRVGGGVSTVRQYLSGRPDRRDASRHGAGLSRRRRKSLCGNGFAGARLRVHRPGLDAGGDAPDGDEAALTRYGITGAALPRLVALQRRGCPRQARA